MSNFISGKYIELTVKDKQFLYDEQLKRIDKEFKLNHLYALNNYFFIKCINFQNDNPDSQLQIKISIVYTQRETNSYFWDDNFIVFKITTNNGDNISVCYMKLIGYDEGTHIIHAYNFIRNVEGRRNFNYHYHVMTYNYFNSLDFIEMFNKNIEFDNNELLINHKYITNYYINYLFNTLQVISNGCIYIDEFFNVFNFSNKSLMKFLYDNPKIINFIPSFKKYLNSNFIVSLRLFTKFISYKNFNSDVIEKIKDEKRKNYYYKNIKNFDYRICDNFTFDDIKEYFV